MSLDDYDPKEDIGYCLWEVGIDYEELTDYADRYLIERTENVMRAALKQGASLDEIFAVASGIAEAFQFRGFLKEYERGHFSLTPSPGLAALQRVNEKKRITPAEREQVLDLDIELSFDMAVKSERWREIAKRLNTSERRVRYILEPPVRRVK